MDPQTQTDIRDSFKDEYISRAAKEMKGLGGWMMRQFDRWATRIMELENDQQKNQKLVSYMILPTIAASIPLVVGLVAAPFITIAAVGAAIWGGSRVWKKANAIADAMIDRDIDNGTLPARYTAEILQPKIDEAALALEALQKAKSLLPATGTAGAAFATAVAPQQPVIETPKPAAPAASPMGPT